jgi:hypothetical protein
LVLEYQVPSLQSRDADDQLRQWPQTPFLCGWLPWRVALLLQRPLQALPLLLFPSLEALSWMREVWNGAKMKIMCLMSVFSKVEG